MVVSVNPRVLDDNSRHLYTPSTVLRRLRSALGSALGSAPSPSRLVFHSKLADPTYCRLLLARHEGVCRTRMPAPTCRSGNAIGQLSFSLAFWLVIAVVASKFGAVAAPQRRASDDAFTDNRRKGDFAAALKPWLPGLLFKWTEND